MLLRILDRLLRHLHGIFEYSDDPGCLFRVRVVAASATLCLGDVEIPRGTRVAELHFWNEHMPRIPASGPDVAWATQLKRRYMASCRSLAECIQRDPRMAGVAAVSAQTVLFGLVGSRGAERLPQRLGFIVLPCRSQLGRFGDFWLNIYTWWLMEAFNPGSLRHRRLLRLRRTQVWMPISEFLGRYA